MNSGTFKKEGKYKIFLGTNDEGERLDCDITKGYEKYFKADLTKTDDFWQDDKEQLEYLEEEHKKRIEKNVRKYMNTPHPLFAELMKEREIKEKEKDLDNLLNEVGIELSE